LSDLRQYGYDPEKTEDEMLVEQMLDSRALMNQLMPRQSMSAVPLAGLHSLIAVRHPLRRLESLYNHKLKDHQEEVWRQLTNRIILTRKPSQQPGVKFRDRITPNEMIREETMQADLELFKSLAGLHDKQRFTSKSNSYNVYPSERENIVGKNFWSQVERQNIFRLGKDSAFKYDLEMFGYSIHDYLTDIGIYQ